MAAPQGAAYHLTGRDQPSLAVKVYLVLQTINVARDGTPNRQVIAARLTRAAADEVVDRVAGTYVEKYLATK